MSTRSDQILGRFFPFATRTTSAAVSTRLPYEIVVLCAADAVAVLEDIVSAHLAQLRQPEQAMTLSTVVQTTLARIAVQVHCSTTERAVLAQLVSRLGYEKTVRSVSWTGLAV